MIRSMLALAATALACVAPMAKAQQFNRVQPVAMEEGRGYFIYRTPRSTYTMFLAERNGQIGPDALSIVGDRPVVKGDPQGGNYFMVGVPPGTYVIYGEVFMGMQSMVGVCMCMGTLKFDVKAGEVVDLGEFSFVNIQGAAGRVSGETLAGLAPGMTTLRVTPNPSGWTFPERIAHLPIRPAEFRAAPKIPNFQGVQIDRITAMPGVLDYRRDQVIDVRTGQALP